jgi:hypothetical protein
MPPGMWGTGGGMTAAAAAGAGMGMGGAPAHKWGQPEHLCYLGQHVVWCSMYCAVHLLRRPYMDSSGKAG